MQISSRFTIAVHIFACIEAFGDQHKLTSDFLAGSVNVNPVIIRKTMSQLQKAGLIKVVKDAESAKATAKTLFESEHNVRMLLVEEAVDIDREIYLSITVDPVESKIMLIAAPKAAWKSKSSPPPIPTRSLPCAWTSPKARRLPRQQPHLRHGAVRGPRQAGRRGRARPVQDLPRL